MPYEMAANDSSELTAMIVPKVSKTAGIAIRCFVANICVRGTKLDLTSPKNTSLRLASLPKIIMQYIHFSTYFRIFLSDHFMFEQSRKLEPFSSPGLVLYNILIT